MASSSDLLSSLAPCNARCVVDRVGDAGHCDRFHGTYPPNYNEGTHLITGKGPTQFPVGPKDF